MSEPRRNWTMVLLHVAGWTLYLVVPVLFQSHDHRFPEIPWEGRIPSAIFNLMLIAFFYGNMHYLIPILRPRYGWAMYVLAVLVSLGLMMVVYATAWNTFVSPPDHGPMDGFGPGHGPPPPDFPDFRGHYAAVIASFLLVYGISTILRFSQQLYELEQAGKDRENVSLKSELSLLRSQISPHFMFNILNSLAALARKKSDQLEPVIIKLSSLMRYTLYESGSTAVGLDTEMEYLRSYIDLQRLRFGDSITVTLQDQVQAGGMVIEPMLLIPFVENAFKHGTNVMRQPEIHISAATTGARLTFQVRNRYDAHATANESSHGIGLQNVRRRLELLYPGRFELVIREDGEWFDVWLVLTLNA